MEQRQWRKLSGERIKVGMGFAFKAKSETFASSNCANKVVQRNP